MFQQNEFARDPILNPVLGSIVDQDLTRKRIIESLEKSEYDWRTLEGIAVETGLERSAIERRLIELGNRGVVVQTTNPNTGEEVFTTRNHYNRTHLLRRVITGMTDSIRF